jgi:N-acetylglucosaminyl-diphospho-decaprenol L-rhamnosyltransferase
MLTVIIVSYNSADTLPGLLDALPSALEGVPDYQVVVVDNDSADASVALAENHVLAPAVLQTGRNAGFAAGINAGAARFAGDGPLLVLNPDTRPDRASIAKLLDALEDPHTGVAAPRLLHEDGTLAHSIRREPSLVSAWSDALLGGKLAGRLRLGEIDTRPATYEHGGPVDYATGAALLISSRARKLVGEWDERYFLYSEEVDYMRRVRDAGLDVVYVPEAGAIHIGGESNTNPKLYALLTTNRIRYFGAYHSPLATLLFRLAVCSGAGLRALLGPTHRAAFRASWASARF